VIAAIGHVLMAIVGGITSVLVAIWNFIVRCLFFTYFVWDSFLTDVFPFPTLASSRP
jgi:hypothetical protein